MRVDVARFQGDTDGVRVGEDRVGDLVHVRRAHVTLGEGDQAPAGVGVVAVGVEAPGAGADQHGLFIAGHVERRGGLRTGRLGVSHAHVGGERAGESARLTQVEAHGEVVDRLGAGDDLAQVVGRRAAAGDALVADRLVAVRCVGGGEGASVVEDDVGLDVEDPGQVVGGFPAGGDVGLDFPVGVGVLPEPVRRLVELHAAV